jgi:hypothetical protein
VRLLLIHLFEVRHPPFGHLRFSFRARLGLYITRTAMLPSSEAQRIAYTYAPNLVYRAGVLTHTLCRGLRPSFSTPDLPRAGYLVRERVSVGVFSHRVSDSEEPRRREILRSSPVSEFSEVGTVFSRPPCGERDIADTRRRTVPPSIRTPSGVVPCVTR